MISTWHFSQILIIKKKITDISILIDDFVILNDAPELKIFLLHIWRAIACQNLVFMKNGGQPDESPFTLLSEYENN